VEARLSEPKASEGGAVEARLSEPKASEGGAASAPEHASAASGRRWQRVGVAFRLEITLSGTLAVYASARPQILHHLRRERLLEKCLPKIGDMSNITLCGDCNY